jgi:iron complex transport system substrate-binding protein
VVTVWERYRGLRVLVVGFCVAIGLVAGCTSAPEQSADPGAVTIAHKFGETTVPADPQRVVTVGWNDQDFVLALAIYETIDQPTCDRLSQIAPTVIQSADYPDEETPWDVQLVTTGRALGKEADAKDLADQVKSKINEAKTANPVFAGKVLVEDFGPETGGHYLLGANDPRRSLFTALGFETQDVTGDVSEEKLSLLDRDVLFVNGATEQQMLESPAFARLGVVRDGRTLYTTFDSNLCGALTYSGPDALLYALGKLVPQLSNALNVRPVADLAFA